MYMLLLLVHPPFSYEALKSHAFFLDKSHPQPENEPHPQPEKEPHPQLEKELEKEKV